MDVVEGDGKLVVTGANFRYTWDTRRGGELSIVEQRGTSDGWWTRGQPRKAAGPWQRVNSTFAWKSLDTIPAISFSTKRGAYYSNEWAIAYANADRSSTLKVIRKGNNEVVFETQSNPKIIENTRAAIPWKVKQTVRVFDSGVILTRLEVTLPKGEVYELDWANMSVNMDDSLYKEPSPGKGTQFVYGWAFPGEKDYQFNSYKPVFQSPEHLPLDIDVNPQQSVRTDKPLLFGSIAYELSHTIGAAVNGYAEACLEDAVSLVGTKEDFGSLMMKRPASGMSPVPTWAGSMRNEPCWGIVWNLYDGKTRGLNDPLTWKNTLAFAVGMRKRSSLEGAAGDERNVLLAARVYYARDKAPSADEVKAMAGEGCNTLILGPWWLKDAAGAAAAVAAAHAANMRVGAAVDMREIKAMVTDAAWFTKLFQKDRDGLLVTGVNFLSKDIPQGDFDVLGEHVTLRADGASHANAAGLAICMRALRGIVGERGFLIGETDEFGPTLLSLAEFDLHCTSGKLDGYRWGDFSGQASRRNRGSAGFGPVLDSLAGDLPSLAAIHADVPIILYPSKDKAHLPLWKAYLETNPKGVKIESDLYPLERRFTVAAQSVHGTLYDGGDGKAVLLLAATKAEAAKVTLTLKDAKVKTLDGADVAVAGGTFDAGNMTQGKIKGFQVSYTPQGKNTDGMK
jgi:hypothetical protein